MFGLSKKEKIFEVISYGHKENYKKWRRLSDGDLRQFAYKWLVAESKLLPEFLHECRSCSTLKTFFNCFTRIENSFVGQKTLYRYYKKFFTENPEKQHRLFLREREEMLEAFINHYFSPKPTNAKLKALSAYKDVMGAEAWSYAKKRAK